MFVLANLSHTHTHIFVDRPTVYLLSQGDSNSSEGETSSQQGDSENQTFISAMVCQGM